MLLNLGMTGYLSNYQILDENYNSILTHEFTANTIAVNFVTKQDQKQEKQPIKEQPKEDLQLTTDNNLNQRSRFKKQSTFSFCR